MHNKLWKVNFISIDDECVKWFLLTIYMYFSVLEQQPIVYKNLCFYIQNIVKDRDMFNI